MTHHHRRTDQASRRTNGVHRRSAVFALSIVTLFAVVTAACVPTPPALPGDTTTTTTSTTTTSTTTTTIPSPSAQLFCKIWDIRHPVDPKGLPLPAPTPAVYFLDKDTIVHARELSQSGADCTDAKAKITFFNAEVVGKNLYLPAGNSLDGVQLKPTPYSLTLAAGQVQAPSIEIATFNLDISLSGIRIYGTLRMTVNGVASIISFDGSFQDLENFSVTLNAPALNLPGIASAPISASGSLARVAGIDSFNFDAVVPSLTAGDLNLSNAAIHLAATTTTGLSAQIQGTLNAAGNSVSLALSAVFDANGQLTNINGSVALSFTGYDATRQPVRLNGQASFSGQASGIVASFSGSGTIGSTSVTQASGRIEINASGVVTITGLFDEVTKTGTVQFQGSIVFDGRNATPNLSAQLSGHYTGFTTAGDIVDIRGTITITRTQTSISGSLQIGPLVGSGSAVVTTVGTGTALALNGTVNTGTINAGVTGVIVFEGNAVSSIDLNGRLKTAATIGNLSVAGTISITSSGSGIAFNAAGDIAGPGVAVSGSINFVVNGQGTLVSLRAGVNGSVSSGSLTVASFAGSLVADSNSATLTGFGTMQGPGVNFGAASGSVVISGGVTTLNLQGQVSITSGSKTVFGDFSIVNNEIEMARVGIVLPPILIDPERVWARLRFNNAGTCVAFQTLEATFLIGLLTGGQAAASALACPTA